MSEMMILWIIVLVATLAIEAMTMGLTTIWFSGGATEVFIYRLSYS